MDGIACPACGCRHLPVNHTRRMKNRIIRYRQCRHCGKNLTTVEKIREENATFENSFPDLEQPQKNGKKADR